MKRHPDFGQKGAAEGEASEGSNAHGYLRRDGVMQRMEEHGQGPQDNLPLPLVPDEGGRDGRSQATIGVTWPDDPFSFGSSVVRRSDADSGH